MARAMGLISLVFSIALKTAVMADDDVEFQDTPLLSSMWEATSSFNNDALDRLLDSSQYAVSSRASDGRGLAWWAYEFQNVHALASIIAHGGDIQSKDEDLQGQPAVEMCEQNPDCNKEDLIAKAEAMVDEIKKKKEEREKAKETAESDSDLDDDLDSSDSESADDDEF